jgi:hypothetical protein
VCETTKGLELPWTKLKEMTTDGSCKGNRFVGENYARSEEPKFQIPNSTSLRHPPTVTLWKNFEI